MKLYYFLYLFPALIGNLCFASAIKTFSISPESTGTINGVLLGYTCTDSIPQECYGTIEITATENQGYRYSHFLINDVKIYENPYNFSFTEGEYNSVNGIYDEGEEFIDALNGIYDTGEEFTDALNGIYDQGEEFTDALNGIYDEGEEFTDALNGIYDLGEYFVDELNGVYDEGESFSDVGVYGAPGGPGGPGGYTHYSGAYNGVYDEGEPFVDGNGVYDEGEEFTDALNGVYDEGEEFIDALNGVYDEGEEFTDAPNGVYDEGEEFIDALNGVYDEGEEFADSILNYYDPTLDYSIEVFFVPDNIIFVDKDASEEGDGMTWNTAFKYLNDAISYANNNSGTYDIWVAEGTYYTDEGALYSNDDQNSVFNIPSNVSSLIGGFSGNEQSKDEANPKQYLTKLSGLIFEEYGASGIGSSYLFTAAGGNPLTVSGFSFNNASDQDGCVLNLSSSNNITFEFCNFSDNQSTENLIQANQNTVFRNCRFERNQTSDGYLIAFGDFESCFFNENFSYDSLVISPGKIDRTFIINNVITQNSYPYYGSIIERPSEVINSVFFRNLGCEFVINAKDSTQILHTTFIDNYNYYSSTEIGDGNYTVGNCIFFRSAFNNGPILSYHAVVGYKSEVNLPVQSAFFGILDYYNTYSSRSSSAGNTYQIQLSDKTDQTPYRGSSVFQNTFFKVFEAVLPELIIGSNPYSEDDYNELINNSKKLFGFSLCRSGDSYLPEFTKEFDIEYPDPFINSSDPLGPDGEPFTEDDGLRLDPNSEWASEVINVPTIDADYELTDILGNDRIIGDLIDLGAYEYIPLEDADGDGISDSNDAFPNNANETLDTDGDGLGDNEDSDDDGDGVDDSVEIATGTDPKQYNSALYSFVQTLGGGAFDADDIAESRLAGQSDVTSDPNAFNLFTQAELTSATETGNTQGQNAVTSDPNSFGLFSSNDISTAQSEFRILGQQDVVSDPLSYGLYSPSYTIGLIDASREAGREDVTSDPSAYGLHSLEEIKDLRAGSTMIEIHNGQATLTMEVEESDDLGVWTNGSATSIQIPIDAGAGKKFFRFKMAE